MADTPYPAYLDLFASGELSRRAVKANRILKHCDLCPWECGVDRLSGETGQCQIGGQARVYSTLAHLGEEKPLSGKYGSGAIFFSGCNLHCQYCQNSDISQDNYGMDVSAEVLAGMMLDLQSQRCRNINLVSPTHVLPQILAALVIAVDEGLRLPIVYNTGGYDKVSSLRLLEGVVDIYLPDMKYADDRIAERISGVKNYPAINRAAVKEMHRQVGNLSMDENGIASRGLIIRHLLLPDELAGTLMIINYIAEKISKDTYLNLMNQYRPEYKARDDPQLNRRVIREDHAKAKDYARQMGLTRLD
jgi:putative pyruvate formate lyase activating enzyme